VSVLGCRSRHRVVPLGAKGRGDLSRPTEVPSLKAKQSVALAVVAAPVPSLSAASGRFAFAAATSHPRCAAGGVVLLRFGRGGAMAHFESRERSELWLSSAPPLPHSPSSAVLVASVSHSEVSRRALASVETGGCGIAAASGMAGVLAPLVASARTWPSARSRRPQPNMAVNRTPRRRC